MMIRRTPCSSPKLPITAKVRGSGHRSVLEVRGLFLEPPRTHQRPSAAHRPSFQGHHVPGHQAPLHRDGPPPARNVLDEVPEWAR